MPILAAPCPPMMIPCHAIQLFKNRTIAKTALHIASTLNVPVFPPVIWQ